MIIESVLLILNPRQGDNIFKYSVNVSELEHRYVITLEGFYLPKPLVPDTIPLNDFITSHIDPEYDQNGDHILCRKDAELLHRLAVEIVNYIRSKVGDFKSTAYQGTNQYLNFDTLQAEFPDIQRK